MRRQDQYHDPSADQMMAAHAQHMSAQRYNNSGPAMGQYSGGPDSFHPGEEHQYGSSKGEGQWQWHKDGPKGSNQMPSHMFKEGQGNDASRSLYEGQRSDSKFGMEKQGNVDPRIHVRQDEVEAGYEDNTLPQTFEGLEQKFLTDIMNLTKELHDAEDRENARHRERLNEINKQYDETIQALRTRQASQREEFLRNESQLRHQQYQANMNSYQGNPVPAEARSGYGSAAAPANAYGDPKRAYGAGQYDPYMERSDYSANTRVGGNARGHGLESRGPYPGGRAYNSGGRQF